MDDEEKILKKALLEEASLINKEQAETASAAPLPEELLAQKIKQDKKAAAKKKRKWAIILGVIGLVYALIQWGLEPPKSSIEYGICKTFLELQVSYPTTLHVNDLNVLSDGSYRLWFSQVDSFGTRRADMFQCFYGLDAETGQLKIAKVRMGAIFIDQQKIEYFNHAIPSLVANPPDLTWPYPLSNNIANLKFDEGAFTNIRGLAERMRL